MDEKEIPFRTVTKVYAVYDKVARELAGNIFTTHHDAAAIRAFTEALGRRDSQIAKHPDDFELVYLGHLICEDTGPTVVGYYNEAGVAGHRVVTTGEAWLASQPLKIEREA